MRNGKSCEACSGLGLLLVRCMVGSVLLLAGYQKFAAPGGASAWATDHLSQAQGYMSTSLANLYVHAVPFAEVILGGLLVVGLLTRASGLVAALMLTSFGIASGGVHGFFKTDYEVASQLFQAPFVYGVLALVALFAGPGAISLDRLLFSGRKAPRERD